MTAESRPNCVYAMAGLKRNSMKLIIVMCVGIALALYGLYITNRSQSNPNYMPTLSVATNWLYHNLVQHVAHPSTFMQGGCSDKHSFKPSLRQMLMYRLIQPITRYSGVFNGLINLGQILILRICCRSIKGANAIIGLSAFGIVVSAVCLAGSFATCKLMCISCLGIHHMIIIYLAMRRRKILQTVLCPTTGQNGQARCTFGARPGNSSSGGGSGPQPPSARTSRSPSLQGQAASRLKSACKHAAR